jgi:hypothetical protein
VTLVTALGLCATFSVPTLAAPTWYALDSAPAGTPPTVVLLPTSSPSQTHLDVTLHGFYVEPVVELGQTFMRLSLDGRNTGAMFHVVGRPDLPALHHTLGSLLGAPAGTPAVLVLNEVSLPNIVVEAYQPTHSANQGRPPYQWDQTFYQLTSQPYPAVRAAASPSMGRIAGLDLVGVEVYPLRAIPASHTLLVAQHLRASVTHSTPTSPFTDPVTQRRAKLFASLLDNYDVVSVYRPAVVTEYSGDYLFVAAPAYLEEIAPLVELKRRRGYEVTVLSTGAIGSDCDDVKAAISDWWDDHPDRDHYALIVGDAEVIGSCLYPCDAGATLDCHTSDRPLACLDGADWLAEVVIGRLPCSTEAECADMVAKNVAYQEESPGWFVNRVALASGGNAGDGLDFPGLMQSIVDYEDYVVPPTFQTLVGPGATNATVRDAVEAGVGILSYAGHGEVDRWLNWSVADFTTAELAPLANGGWTPIQLSFACLNGVFDEPTDGLSESWLATDERAVAAYGATAEIDWGYAQELAKELHKSVFEHDNVILGEAIESVVSDLIAELDDFVVGDPPIGVLHAPFYQLFGDPDLKIWREHPDVPFIGGYPNEVPPGAGEVEIHVGGIGAAGTAPAGASVPIPLAIVSLYKPGDFQVNRYTDANGDATLPIAPTSPGWIYVTVHTEFDSRGVARDSIHVGSSTGVDGGGTEWGELRLDPPRPNPFARHASLPFAIARPGPVRLQIFDPQGRRVRTLVNAHLPAGRQVASWNGATESGARAGAGLYLARLEAGGRAITRRLLLAR